MSTSCELVKITQSTDVESLEVYYRLRRFFEENSREYGPAGNIIGVFFHDLIIHFTGIVIHRDSVGEYGKETDFPWVNKRYALNPTPCDICNVVGEKAPINGIRETIRSVGFLPVASGASVPFRTELRSPLRQLVQAAVFSPRRVKVFLPQYRAQFELLDHVVFELCRDFNIANRDVIRANWRQYSEHHTTTAQTKLKERGILVGTRNSLHNRKLAANFLQQNLPVVGFTHGEICNQIFDEPVYSYSDRSLCSTLIEYGDYRPTQVEFTPIVRPSKEIRRTSIPIKQIYRPNNEIRNSSLYKSRSLLIPTIYQQNYMYGPKHTYETDLYFKWHQALALLIPNMTIKVHPKTRVDVVYPCGVDRRPLNRCLHLYDVLIFDFLATGSAFALFSDRPVIYFDIGLRELTEEFLTDLRSRAHVVSIDWSDDWIPQIREGINSYESGEQTHSNISLKKYALPQNSDFSMLESLVDLLKKR